MKEKPNSPVKNTHGELCSVECSRFDHKALQEIINGMIALGEKELGNHEPRKIIGRVKLDFSACDFEASATVLILNESEVSPPTRLRFKKSPSQVAALTQTGVDFGTDGDGKIVLRSAPNAHEPGEREAFKAAEELFTCLNNCYAKVTVERTVPPKNPEISNVPGYTPVFSREVFQKLLDGGVECLAQMAGGN